MTTAVEKENTKNCAPMQGQDSNRLLLPGGVMNVQWDENAVTTQWGGLAGFVQFLNVTKLFDRLVNAMPLKYTSPNAPEKRDILGSIVLAVLCGFTRYIHIERLRNDNACRKMFGLTTVLSDSSIRRALKKMSRDVSDTWLIKHAADIVGPLLEEQYIIDVDNTVKPIYGHQEGAELGYNPQKPGRPSHNYHTFFIGAIRMCIGVDVEPGSKHSGGCGMPCVFDFIDAQPPKCKPNLLRGDVGYGTDAIMTESEKRAIKYLFKIKRSKTVRSRIADYIDTSLWKDCGDGWEAIDDTIKLDGWKQPRRCVFVRRPAEEKKKDEDKKKVVTVELGFDIVESQSEKKRKWDTYALVTNIPKSEMDATILTATYRKRGDCENNFDEYKNQWGWCGFVTKKFQPCRIMARLIAIVANWWNVYCRLANGKEHMEAITSRPMLMQLVGRITKSHGQHTLYLTSTHAQAKTIKEVLDRSCLFLNKVSEVVHKATSTARQLDFETIWGFILRCAFRYFLDSNQVTPWTDGKNLFAKLE